MRRALFIVVASAALVACPPADSQKSDASQTTSKDGCTRVGQSCEFSAGKLGTCVQKEGCTEATAACFTCQSQH